MCYACHAPKAPAGPAAAQRATCVRRGHHNPRGVARAHEHAPAGTAMRQCTDCSYLVVAL